MKARKKTTEFKRLRAVPLETGGLAFTCAGLVAEVMALAPDLFRFRVARGRQLPQACSWAVCKEEWDEIAAAAFVENGSAWLDTGAGRFEIKLKSGAWMLKGADGGVRVESKAGLRFEGAKSFLELGLAAGESIFGLGESTGQFNRRGMVRDFWNIDVLGHAPAIHPGLKSLYVSIPFAVTLRNGAAGGLFWDNPARQVWDLGQTKLDLWQLNGASGEVDLYLFTGPDPASVVERYTELTGRIPLPPRWALGFQQCRYSYERRERFEEVAREFRTRKLPCDVLYLDIHHMDGYRVFTFGKTFPKPAEMIRKLDRQGFKVVTIVDPGVKNDAKFGVLKRGVAANAFVKAADGAKDFLGEVWPGEARFPDFLNATTRAWWGREQKALQDLGVAGFWNDMNEPANFARPDKTLDPKAIHRTDHGKRTHEEAHNLYGMQMARASRDGALAARPDKRPFVITRAGYAGIQRHALVWTGDNSSNWDHLNDAVQMFLNLSVSGVAFCGGDVGGFMDNATPELFTRWFEFAALTPFFRSHTNLGTIDHEPWAFGPDVESHCRRILGERYRMLPHLYRLFAEARATGAPVMRPLFWHFPGDPVAVACGDQFLLGTDLMAAPVLRQGAVARSVYLPAGVWFDYRTGERFDGGRHVIAQAGLGTIPLYVRGGGVVPLGPIRQFVDESADSEIELHVWAGGSGMTLWYEDDGATNGYESGELLERTLTVAGDESRLKVVLGEVSGGFRSTIKRWRIVPHGLAGVDEFVTLENSEGEVAAEFVAKSGA
jgi:alpha-glucosidase